MAAPAFAPSRVRAHLRIPVLRAGYALVASSMASSALGVVYWFVAARRYDTESVGIGSALVAATTLLAGLANLGLKNGLLRFVPQAGRDTGRLIRRSYALSAVCACVAGVIFLAGVRVWAPDLAFLRHGVVPCVVFVATLAAWAVFVLQDSVLVGLGQAPWVPVENIVFSVAKILMLLGLVYLSPRWGVFLSWGVPTVALIVVVNWGIARRMLPRHVAVAADREPPAFSQVLRFSVTDQAATILWMATLDGLPLLVLRREGASAAAYYYLAAQIAYGLYFLSGCIGAALVAEGARDPDRLAELNRRVTRQAFWLVVPTTAVVVIGAPWVLGIFGAAYRDNATDLLRLLSLSALPYTVTSIALSRARVQQRMTTVVAGHGAIFVLCVGIAAVMLPRYGLVGVGVGVLLGQTIVCGVVLASGFRHADRQLPFIAVIACLAGTRSRVRRLIAARRLPAQMARAPLPEEFRGHRARLLSAHNDVIVAEVGGRGATAIVKVATRRGARFGLIDHVRALQALHADRRLTVLAAAFPSIITEGVRPGFRYVVETTCPGTADSEAFLDKKRVGDAMLAVSSFMTKLHTETSSTVDVDSSLFEDWVGRPLRMMASAVGNASANYRRGEVALVGELRTALLGRRVTVARVHGDLTPGNILLAPDGREVTGLVDWERSRPDGLPGVDLAMFVLALRRERRGLELGALVLEAAKDLSQLEPDERRFLHAASAAGVGVSSRHLVLLAWLAHVESNLTKGERYRNSRWWIRHNVVSVVEGLLPAPALRPSVDPIFPPRRADPPGPVWAAAGPAATPFAPVAQRVERSAPVVVALDRFALVAVGSGAPTQVPEGLLASALVLDRSDLAVPINAPRVRLGTLAFSGDRLKPFRLAETPTPAFPFTRVAAPTGRSPSDPLLDLFPPRSAPAPERIEAPSPLVQHVVRAAAAFGGLATMGLLAGAFALWLWSLRSTDVRSMTDTGLVSVMPPYGWIAIAAIGVGVVHALTRPAVSERRLLVLLSGYIVMIHATAPVLYQTLRYSWAWKHVGIVDYIVRHGSVNPHISSLDVYHNWPGFFSANAVLVELIGTKNAIAIAMWAPLVINLLDLGALRLLLPTLGADRRTVWTATWIFLLANWVGQDYFAPQAMAYFIHLVLLAIVLRHFGLHGGRKRTGNAGAEQLALRRSGLAAGLIVVALAATMISSHQLTPGMMIVVLGLLLVTRRARVTWILLASVIMQALWLVGPARAFAAKNLASMLRSFGSPVENAGGTMRDTTSQSSGQAIVSFAGRSVVLLVVALAMVGLIVRLRRGHRDVTALILLCSPAMLVVANEFGGEILFRAFLFAVPFLALFAAWALLPAHPNVPGRTRTALLLVVSCALFSGFVLAHFGKDGHYHFSREEIAASTFLAENAMTPTLLVEGSRNYPTQFLNYERFVFVPITQEPPDTLARVLADPAARLEEWLADPRYARSYVLITRSQKADILADGANSAGALELVEKALRASPRFTIAFQNRDATVFSLSSRRLTS